jgi:hypothetical protein
MTTAFAQVVGAVIAALQAAPAVCDTIYRARTTPVPDSVDQAVSVQWNKAQAQPAAIFGAPLDWQTLVTVECYSRSVRDGSGDVAVDPLLQAVYARLAQDTTLGGLVEDLYIAEVEAENNSEGKKNGWVRLTYVAVHSTSNSTLE